MKKSYQLALKYGAIAAAIYSIYRIALFYISIPIYVNLSLIMIEGFLVYPALVFILSKKIRNTTEGWSFSDGLKHIVLLMLSFNVVSIIAPLYMRSINAYEKARPYAIDQLNALYKKLDAYLSDEERLKAIAKLDVKHSLLEMVGNHFTDFLILKIILLLFFALLLKNKKK